MEYWNNGMMEKWNNGIMEDGIMEYWNSGFETQYSKTKTPVLQYSKP